VVEMTGWLLQAAAAGHCLEIVEACQTAANLPGIRRWSLFPCRCQCSPLCQCSPCRGSCRSRPAQTHRTGSQAHLRFC
jgi:hypothetical protein